MENQLSDIYVNMLSELSTYGHKFTDDGELVKDCIHDVFLKLLENKDISAIHNIKFYILRSLKNRLMDELSRKPLQHVCESSYCHLYTKSCEDHVIAKEEIQRIKSGLEKSLNCLTRRQKELIRLYYIEQRSYKDICEILHITYQAAQNTIHKALTRLRKNIDSTL